MSRDVNGIELMSKGGFIMWPILVCSILALSIGIGLLLNVSRHCAREDMIRVRGATRRRESVA